MIRWKTLKNGLKSGYGNMTWEIKKWYHEGNISLCHSGFHCSRNILDAFGYVSPGIVAKVETKGDHISDTDKEVWSDMRVLQAWQWTKEDSVALAIYAAELVIDIYEKQYPNDDRPRKAIEAAKEWLKKPSQDAAYAAYAAAYAAYAAADAAADAADAAAYAADAAAYAADAAYAAAYAAYAAAYAAYAAYAADAAYAAYAADAAYAAYAAADAALKKKINKWIISRLKQKEVIS